jgi:cytochrome c-type biogenesis protein CcmH/NrfF
MKSEKPAPSARDGIAPQILEEMASIRKKLECLRIQKRSIEASERKLLAELAELVKRSMKIGH